MKTDFLKSVNLSSGQKSSKVTLIKKDFYVSCECKDDIDRKNLRTKIRKVLKSYIHAFVKNNKLSDDEKKSFVDFYKKVYETNDFSVSSVYDGNDDETKENLKKMLSFVAPKDNKK